MEAERRAAVHYCGFYAKANAVEILAPGAGGRGLVREDGVIVVGLR